MSKRYNYDDIDSLFKKWAEHEKIKEPKYQIYALKFIVGLIDREISKLHSLDAKNFEISQSQQRLAMLKRLAGTIASLPIPKEEYDE